MDCGEADSRDGLCGERSSLFGASCEEESGRPRPCGRDCGCGSLKTGGMVAGEAEIVGHGGQVVALGRKRSSEVVGECFWLENTGFGTNVEGDDGGEQPGVESGTLWGVVVGLEDK